MQKSANEIMALCNAGKPVIMGVVNVTPDSFSDGGEHYDTHDAVARCEKFFEDGAQILDIGGESTRPGAQTVSLEEEQKRVLPVIRALEKAGAPIISIDTRNAKTMQKAVDSGANFINDISGLQGDPESVSVVAQTGAPLCIMHMQGTPQTMQDRPKYESVLDEVIAYFEERLEYCAQNGVMQNRVILDPGIGFGKTLEHNLTLIKNLKEFHRFGCPVLLGVSRKSFIQAISGEEDPKQRLAGSLSAAIYGLEAGVQIYRVHDVKETKQAFDVYNAIKNNI